jgi:hypothetical protein
MSKTPARNLLRVLDVLLLPFTYLSLLWLRAVRFAGLRRMPCSRRAILHVGVFPLRDHFYEPLFHPARVAPGFDRKDRELPAVDLNVGEQLEILGRFRFADELLALSREPPGEGVPRLSERNFDIGDSQFLYSMVRLYRPRRVFEIGSGNSSWITLRALRRNAAEDPARAGTLTCIDPRAPARLDATGARVIRRPVEELGREFFRELDRDDVLFIDSSHMIRPGGDVLFEFLEVLPTLRPGVLIHVHDICTPRDVPAGQLFEHTRFWNEQYLLEAFLCHNRDFRVVGALHHLWVHHFEALAEKCPLLKERPAAGAGSFWLVRN